MNRIYFSEEKAEYPAETVDKRVKRLFMRLCKAFAKAKNNGKPTENLWKAVENRKRSEAKKPTRSEKTGTEPQTCGTKSSRKSKRFVEKGGLQGKNGKKQRQNQSFPQ